MWRKPLTMVCLGVLVCLSVVLFSQSETLDETLVRVRKQYPAQVTGAQAAAILNETAWVHRGEGIALLGKAGGSNCPQPKTGQKISCDFLLKKINGIWRGKDVLIATGKADSTGPATPATPVNFTEDMSEMIKNGSRTVVMPVDSGVVTPPEPPNPCPACPTCPPPTVCPTCPPDLSAELGACVATTKQQIAEVERLIKENLELQQKLQNVKCVTANSFWRALGIGCRVVVE